MTNRDRVSFALLVLLGAAAALRAAPAENPHTIAGPHVTAVYPVAPDTLCVVIRHGKVTPSRQEAYAPAPGDQPKPWRYHNWLERDGQVIGTVLGVNKDMLFIPPKLDDQPLNDEWAGKATNYRLQSTGREDAAFAEPQSPSSVRRKARATDVFRTDVHKIQGPREHLIYLTFSQPLKAGASYELSFADHEPAIAAATYQHHPRKTRSEAVHVSQVGFRPDDPLKLAYLSLWTGDGGGFKFAADLPFELIRTSDGTSVFKGKAVMGLPADQVELPGKVNHTGADVWKLEFTSFADPGEYVVYVEGVGHSHPFPIANDVWHKAQRISVRGLYHQRSGIALGPPHTDFVRPRSFHPEDGVVINTSTAQYVEPGKGSAPEELFSRLVKGNTGQATTAAWGGYQDAGDWDRRAEHMVASRCLFDLVTAFPDYAKSQNLNIPESGNNLPDMVDEALWGLDCYRRMQQPDGSVSAGIESAEHPRIGEASWQESHPIFQYAPDPWATGLYAATAAQAARVLQTYDTKLAEGYRDTALLAMNCIEKQQAEGTLEGYDSRVHDARNLAAVQLYALTGDPKWHEVFKTTTAFTKAQGRTAKWKQFDQSEAIFAYLLLPADRTDPTIRKWGVQAVVNEADQLIVAGNETGFGWTGSPAIRIGWGRLTSPRTAIPLIYAYRLTGEGKYLEAMVRACQYATGANPLNLCFTTGVGKQWPRHVCKIDAEVTNQAVPEGLTPLGPQEWMLANSWWVNPYLRTYPAYKGWPTCEMYIDSALNTTTTEPTVHNSITPTFYMWGHLAARPAIQVAERAK